MVELPTLLKLEWHEHEIFNLLEIQDNTTTATTKMFIQGNPHHFVKKGSLGALLLGVSTKINLRYTNK